MLGTATANTVSAVSGMGTKVNKVTPQSRKGNALRLSLRRFSHGTTVTSSKASKLDAINSDSNASTLDLETYPWLRCHQVILRLAQGERVELEERVKVSVSLRNVLMGSRNLAVVLLSELFAISSLQAALRHLASAFDKCTNESSISGLWLQFYTVVLPDLHAVLYPFEEPTVSDVRKLILTAFRDGVVLDQDLCYGVLNNANSFSLNPLIHRMLLILEQTTRDGSPEYSKIQRLCGKLIDDFSSPEISLYQPPRASSPSPQFFIEDQNVQRRSSSPKPLQRLIRRAKGSFTALASGEPSELVTGTSFLDVKPSNQARSRSPLARVRTLLSESSADAPRRHSYAPGST